MSDYKKIDGSPILPDLKFIEVFDINEIQRIQDAFSAATGVASLITDINGNTITNPSNFSRLCKDIIRSTDLGLKNCMYSDSVLGRSNSEGPNIQPCLSCGLFDAGASIFFGDRHVANWLIGQVIVDASQKEKILEYATSIGADSLDFKAALEEVPRMPLERFETISSFLFVMANQISRLAIQGVYQKAEICERHKVERILRMEQDKLAKLHEELQQSYETTIEGWALALELRDLESAGHSRRVTDMTVRIAEKLGISKEEQINLRRGALLHDIGKLSIPDSILLKPGPLTNEEWEIMKMHPIYAEKLLEPSPFLHFALDIPCYHHEKWDGTGYPRGLKTKAIPVAARIFAIVDVYDALIYDRPYRKAWSKSRAIDYIRSQEGTHFEPMIVATFLQVLAE